MKKLLLWVVLIIGLPILYFACVITIGTITNYKPGLTENISKIDEGFELPDSTVFSAMIWNIGYAGLGSKMDFFFDGGEMVRDTKVNVLTNLYQITRFIKQNDSIDFILLQEVDIESKRSHGINMLDHFNLAMPEYFPFFAANYNVKYVPMPLFNPMGKVNSGLLTLSKHIPLETTRYSFPGNFSWPQGLFMLDRCYLVNKFQLSNSKYFYLVNTHNSAYDDGGLRQQQNIFLNDYLNTIADSGSFLVGGDWNQSPPTIDTKGLPRYLFDTVNFTLVDDLLQGNGAQFYFDPALPTNRRVIKPYAQEDTPVTIIDYFLASDVIEVISCNTVDLGFQNSDHQPVIISFKFK